MSQQRSNKQAEGKEENQRRAQSWEPRKDSVSQKNWSTVLNMVWEFSQANKKKP